MEPLLLTANRAGCRITAPFTQEEAKWLINNVNNFSIFSSVKDEIECDTALYMGKEGGMVPYECVHRSIGPNIIDSKGPHVIRSELEYRGKSRICRDREELSKVLAGRHGPEIKSEYTWYGIGGRNTTTTISLLDVHSYFLIIKKRLEASGHTRASEVAKKKTKEYLASIVSFYQEKKHCLELYLLASLHLDDKHNFRVIKDALKYGSVDDLPYMVSISNNCERYKDKLHLMIDKSAPIHTTNKQPLAYTSGGRLAGVQRVDDVSDF